MVAFFNEGLICRKVIVLVDVVGLNAVVELTNMVVYGILIVDIISKIIWMVTVMRQDAISLGSFLVSFPSLVRCLILFSFNLHLLSD